MFYRRKKDGLILTKYMECHNRNCEHCQSIKMKKYLGIISKTPIVWYKVVPSKDAPGILQKIRRTGNFYWRCALRGNTVAIISTSEITPKWIPFPIDICGEDAELIMRGWLSKQFCNLS